MELKNTNDNCENNKNVEIRIHSRRQRLNSTGSAYHQGEVSRAFQNHSILPILLDKSHMTMFEKQCWKESF